MLDIAFQVSTGLTIVGCLALLLTPLAPRTANIAGGFVVPALIIGVALIVFAANPGAMMTGFGSVGAIAETFSHPAAALVILLHAMALDLFFAGWMVRVSRREGISFWLIAPAIVFIAFIGSPLILLVFFAVQAIRHRRRAAPGETINPPAASGPHQAP